MEVERAGGLEDAVHFEEARDHHDEIGRHVVAPEKGDEGVHQLRHVGVRLLGEGGEFGLGPVRLSLWPLGDHLWGNRASQSALVQIAPNDL